MSQKHTTISFLPTSVLDKGTEMEVIDIWKPADSLCAITRIRTLSAELYLLHRPGSSSWAVLLCKGHTD